MASSSRRPPERRSRIGSFIRFLFYTGLIIGGLGLGFAWALVAAYSKDLPDVDKLRTYQPSGTTRIFASNGELIATLFKENRTWIALKDIPECMRQAIVASEDSRFYQHPGFDPVGIARALWWAVRSRGTRQGASTITMQLARGIFLNTDLTARRKIQEVLISWQIERKFTKDQILEFYLNQIYFGSGAYGVEAASTTYFGKRARQLDVAEAAMLVGTVPAPSDYSPHVDRKLADERQQLVLKRMQECGFITPEQLRKATAERLRIVPPRKDQFILKMPYFTTWLLRDLAKRYGDKELYEGGLKIYTTVDPALQEAAEEAIRWGIASPGAGHNIHQGALVAIEPQTGFVKAMVGGTGWSDQNQFNRAWQSQRSPGSSFKIFVYSAALQAGFTPDSIVPDVHVSLREGPGDFWSPKNSDGRFMGSIPLRTALQYSRNTVSAQLVERLTPGTVIDLAYQMGIKSHIDPHLSIALGAVSVSPLEMASALTVVANGGMRLEPVAIKMIQDASGNIKEDNRHREGTQVLSPITALAMTEMLQNAVNAGTGGGARLTAQPAAGKTGTTDSHRDAWFCGFTPSLVAAVWVGNDDNSEMWGTFGGDVPAPIWRRFMEAALKGKPVRHFGADEHGNVRVAMCSETGRRATTQCPKTEQEPFPWDRVPQRFCTAHVFAGTRSAKGPASPEPSSSPGSEEDASPTPLPAATAEEGAQQAPTPLPESPETAPPDTAPGPADEPTGGPTHPSHPATPPPAPRPTPREEPPPVEPPAPRPTPGDRRREPPAPRPTPGDARHEPPPPGPAVTPE